MGVQRGRNRSGLTGLVDLPNLGSGVQFHADIYRWQKRLDGGSRPRRGRGGGRFATARWVFSSGNGACSGNVPLADWPTPDQWKGQAGTITVQIANGRTITFPVLITGYGYDFDVDKTDEPKVSLTYTVTADPVYTGWAGTQPAATDPSKSDQEQYEGTTKTLDPKSLQSSATRITDVWGDLADTDAAEQAKLAAMISAAQAPYSGMKLRAATFARDAIDGGTVTEQWGLTDTQDDVEMPESPTSDDVSDLADSASICQVTSSSTPPSVPSAPVGQHVQTDTLQLNDGRWKHVFSYGNTTNAQKLTFPESPIDADPTTIKDQDQQSILNTSSTPPATPSPRTADLQLRRRTSTRVSGTPEQWQHTFYFARNTVKDDIEIDGENQANDPNDIGETAVIRQVTNSATPPAAPAAPVGQLVETSTEPLVVPSGDYSGYWVHTFRYGATTRLQEIQFKGELIVDPQTITDSDVIPVVTDTSTAPSTPTPDTADLKLVRRRAQRIQGTPEKWVHTFEFARNDAKDERETAETITSSDPDDFAETAKVAKVAATQPSTPSAPVGQLIGIDARPLTVPSGDYTGLSLFVFRYGATTRKQEIEQEGAISADAGLLDDSDVQTLTNSSSTPPATPAARITSQVLQVRRSRKIQNTPEKWSHEFTFGWRTSAGKLVADNTVSTVDVDSIEDEYSTAAIYTGIAPSDPSAPSATVQLLSRTDKPTNNPAYTLRIYRWAVLSSEQKRTFPKISTTDDALNIEDEAIRAQFWNVGDTPPATPTDAPTNNVKLITFTDAPVTPARNVRVWLYGPQNSGDKLILRNWETVTDASAVRSTAIRAMLDGGSITDPTGYVLRETKEIPVTQGLTTNRTLTVKVYGLTTVRQDMEFESSEGSADPLGNYDTITASLVSNTAAPQDLADSLMAANQSDATFIGAKVKQITPDLALQILRFSGDDKSIRPGGSHVLRDAVRGVPATSVVSGQYLPGNISLTDTQALVLINFNGGNLLARPQYIWRSLGRFTLRRVYSLSTTDLESSGAAGKLYLALRGTINDDVFLGYLAGEVIYSGPSAAYTYAVSGAHRVIVDYEFQTDNWKHMNDGYLPEGPTYVNSGSISASGAFNATQFEAGYICIFPNQSDFSGFLT